MYLLTSRKLMHYSMLRLEKEILRIKFSVFFSLLKFLFWLSFIFFYNNNVFVSFWFSFNTIQCQRNNKKNPLRLWNSILYNILLHEFIFGTWIRTVSKKIMRNKCMKLSHPIVPFNGPTSLQWNFVQGTYGKPQKFKLV